MPIDTTDAAARLDLVRRAVGRELAPEPLPSDDVDLGESGRVDSMMQVNILLAVEEAAGVEGFAAEWPEDRPFSVRQIAEGLLQAQPTSQPAEKISAGEQRGPSLPTSEVSIKGWAFSAGSLVIPAEQIDAECGFESGFLRDRAGIETERRASADEDESALAVRSAEGALEVAGLTPASVDLLVGVSTTDLDLPSFAARVHAELLLCDTAGAVDIGGACCGVIYGLATALSLLSTMNKRTALVVASEVNSRRLASMDVPPEFRALFGDAACAFVLERTAAGDGVPGRRLRDFIWGASSTFSSALSVVWPPGGGPHVEFSGQQLAGAAIETLERVFDRLANLSGVLIADVDQFALHEPNPRVVAMLARKAGIPPEKVPQTSPISGNLGSVTCGVNLCKALAATADADRGSRASVTFAAAVGPGLLWGGAYIS